MIVNYKMIFFKVGGVSLITGASDIYIPFKLSTSFKCIKKIRIDHGLGTITPVTRRKLRESSSPLSRGQNIRWHKVGLIASHSSNFYLKRMEFYRITEGFSVISHT